MAEVFRFTFKQQAKGKGFLFATFVFPALLCLVCILACVFMAKGSVSVESVSVIQKVYVTNHTELSYMDFSDFSQFAGEEYQKTEFLMEGKPEKEEKYALNIEIAESKKEYAVKVSIPKWSKISRDEAENFNELLAGYVEKLRTMDAVMRSKGNTASENDILTALMPVTVERTTEGDEAAGMGAEMMKMLFPMLIVFLLYFMVLLYGQAIGQNIISEKVSKLMETILITVKPYQLIAGKILAIVVIAVLQIILWVLGLILGLFLGNLAAKQINPSYTNSLFEAGKLLREFGAGMAFSIPAVILAVLSLICGFIFYCVLSGLFASPVSKAEELASSFGLYQVLVVIAFLVSYMLPLQGIDSEVLRILLYVIPFTSSFMLSGDILVGNIGILNGAGYLGLLAVFTAGTAVYAGKLYKDQVFFNNASGKWLRRLMKN